MMEGEGLLSLGAPPLRPLPPYSSTGTDLDSISLLKPDLAPLITIVPTDPSDMAGAACGHEEDGLGLTTRPDSSTSTSSCSSTMGGSISPDSGRQLSSFSSSSDESDSTDSKASKKHPWTSDEDEALRMLVQKHGPKDWGKIAANLPNRNGKQCHQRWNYFLNPQVRKGLWSDEEDRNIMYWQKIIGNKWAKIAGYLPGRTGHAVKNRYHQMSNGMKRRRTHHSSSSSSSSSSSGSSSSSCGVANTGHDGQAKMWVKQPGQHDSAPLCSSQQQQVQEGMTSPSPMLMSTAPAVPQGGQQQQHDDGMQQQEHQHDEGLYGGSQQQYHHLQLQAASMTTQQMQTAQHLHATHQQLLEQHQHETLKYPWQDCDDCPAAAYQYVPQQQAADSRLLMPADPLTTFNTTTNGACSKGSMGSSTTNSNDNNMPGGGSINTQIYYQADDLDMYYQQQPYPLMQPSTTSQAQQQQAFPSSSSSQPASSCSSSSFSAMAPTYSAPTVAISSSYGGF